MDYKEAKEIVLYEGLSQAGAMQKIRENHFDSEGFERLQKAVQYLATLVNKEETSGEVPIERVIYAVLFEIPYEIENTYEHFRQRDTELGQEVISTAGELREAISELLWVGLEKYYT